MGANLKEVRERIKSVKSTQQITKAMKMVSAAKLRRAQVAITQMRPYADKLNEMLKNIMATLEGDATTTYGDVRPVEHAMVVVVTSNRGLAGAFNTNVIKKAVETIDTKFAEQRDNGKLEIICIGKKGYDFFKKRYENCSKPDRYVDLFKDLSFDNVAVLSKWIMSEFSHKKYDAVEVVYSSFKNAATQIPISAQFLPVDTADLDNGDDQKASNVDYLYEPSKNTLLEHLVPSILQTTFHKYLLDTHAGEHGARMSAMDKATENAGELMKELKVSYNKARQEAITRELSEIVSGAAALGGG